MEQQVTGDQMESGHRKLDYWSPTDDEEVTLPPHNRATEVPDIPDTDIRDRQAMSDTQQEDRLLQMEPLHGACPRQTGRERPPVIEDRPLLEATGGVDGRRLDHNGIQAPLLSPGRQILMEEEVTTPPRGSRPAVENQGLPPRGAVRSLSLRVHHAGCEQCLKFLRRSVHGIVVWTDRKMLGRRSIYWWTRLHECNRTWQITSHPSSGAGPRQVAFTTTKVPQFDGTTSWEQYRQVLDAIVWSNGWDNDMAALQLFSHLEGDALNVAHLVPLSRRLSRSGLVEALTAHYGLPGRLADYRRQFERTTRTVGEDPAIFATALETLAVKAFGNIGQTTRLQLIRDRFIAGHSSCELHRHLDSVPPETPIRDVVDRCRVWESHADPAVRGLVNLVRIRSIQPML